MSPHVRETTTIDPATADAGSRHMFAQTMKGWGFGAPANLNLQKQGPHFRDDMSASQLSRLGDFRTPDCNVDSPPFFGASKSDQGYHNQNQMHPPYLAPVSFSPFLFAARSYLDDEAEHRSKRTRFGTSFDPDRNLPRSEGVSDGPSQVAKVLYNASRYPGSVLTPALSTTSVDYSLSMPAKPPPIQDNHEIRRLSVKSLLSDDFEQPDSGRESINPPCPLDSYLYFGVDRGLPDLDLPRNNDAIALNGLTPALSMPSRDEPSDEANDLYAPIESWFGLYNANTAHREGDYYAKPVSVFLSKSLGTLPSTLQSNPMNLLYFHHFLNHTARLLVPHDCTQNPFRTILTKIALHDMKLLNLLLAYSASHRARLLKHPEPANRIALWVQDIFPALSRDLDDPSAQISNANLATAIMLASLEIISPNTFEVPIPWQSHLNVARRMLMARGGAKSVHRKDVVSYFLSRWFAYLDVLGSLSGGKNDQPLFGGDYWANDHSDDEGDLQIDCLIGFTSRCVGIFAKIAELARQCDSKRIDSDGAVIDDWTPPAHILPIAQSLKSDLQDARLRTYRGCPHKHGTDVEDAWDTVEMVATNEAFHWAGLIHLDRRVFGKSSSDPEIQAAVGKIVDALDRVRKGSTAEACLLFPMFTAGCHAKGEGRRGKILERLRSVEGSGMTQVCL